MTSARFEEIILGRTLLEPELAARALPAFDADSLALARRWDSAVDEAIAAGDAGAYARANWEFHAHIYTLAGLPMLFGLVESLWLQVGPFMRQMAGRFGTANLEDQHALALMAIETGNEELLRQAIRQDILDGLTLVRSVID